MRNFKSDIINGLISLSPDSLLEKRHLIKSYEAKKAWLNDESFFIHIPKSGGTSVAAAFSRKEPGHASWRYLTERFPGIENKKNYYLICRNPNDRILSTFSYLKGLHQRFGTSSLPAVKRYSNVNDFILDYLSKKDVDSHYFMRSIHSTISGAPLEKIWAIDFSDLNANFQSFSVNVLGKEIDLPHENSSSDFKNKEKLDAEAIKVIEKKYSKDWELYDKVHGYGYVTVA